MSVPELTHVPLGPFDHWVPRGYFHVAHYLPLKTGVTVAQAFDLLHEGLHRVFVEQPWLDGQVGAQAPSTPGWRPGQLEIRHRPTITADGPRPRQLRLKELATDLDYETLRELGFPLDAFSDAELAPYGPDSFATDPATAPCDVFAAQANFLPGGCLLVAAIHHVVCDEGSFFRILNLWGGHCASLQTGAPPPEPLPAGSLDRRILREIWEKEKPAKTDPEGWRLIGLDPRGFQADAQLHAEQPPLPPPPAKPAHVTNTGGERKMKSGVFYVSPERFAALGKDVAGEVGAESRVTVNDAIAALLWRCLMRARAAAMRAQGVSIADARGVLLQINDGRGNYSPAMPQTYIGNLAYHAISTLPLEKLVDPKTPLGTVAALLRRNWEAVSSADLLNMFSLVDALSSYDELGRAHPAMGAADGTLLQFISSLIGVSMDSMCFGDGPVFANRGFVEALRPLLDAYIPAARLCNILPRHMTGGVEIVTNLYQDEYELLLLDDEFSRYVLCLCWPED